MLGKRIVEESLADLEREKTMLDLELKQMLLRHHNEMNAREAAIQTV